MGIRFGGTKRNKRRMRITFRGDAGKKARIAVIIAASVALTVAALVFFKPKTQLMNTAEMRKIADRGVLIVGVRTDVPHFADSGVGFEIELAERFARYLLPDTGAESAVKFVSVSAPTASTKLSDGSIDAAVALMQKGANGKFAYSYPYYTDECVAAVRHGDERRPIEEMNIGYVQSTAGSNALSRYISSRETKVERTLLDKLLGRTPAAPENAVVYKKTAFASYPDMLRALETGGIDCAAIPRVYFERYAKEYNITAHTEKLGNIEYAIAVSADEPAIAQLADVFLYELKQSGTLDEMLNKYGLKGAGG